MSGILRGEISASHVEQTRCCLQDFVAAIGPGRRFNCVGQLDLDAYRARTLSLPISEQTGKPIAIQTARARLKAVSHSICEEHLSKTHRIPEFFRIVAEIGGPAAAPMVTDGLYVPDRAAPAEAKQRPRSLDGA